jgi:DNA-binding winged helix-turn-helix (wHTH) protein
MGSNHSNFRFGCFELRTGEHRLLSNGTFIPLPRKTYEILLTLVMSKGEVVTKEKFFRRIWPDTFNEEGSLTTNISILRKTLDSAGKANYIETIPRVGYRLAVEVSETLPFNDVAPKPRSLLTVNRRKTLPLIISASALLISGTVNSWLFHLLESST